MEDQHYTSRHIAAMFKITQETVRIWSETFAEFLSPTANPGANKTRLFSFDDLRVFGMVARLRSEHLDYKDIIVNLRSGQREDFPMLPPSEIDTVIANEDQAKMGIQLQLAQARIQQLSVELQDKQEQLNQMVAIRDDNIRKQATIDHMLNQITELKSRLQEEYNRGIEAGKLLAEIESLKRQLDQKGD